MRRYDERGLATASFRIAIFVSFFISIAVFDIVNIEMELIQHARYGIYGRTRCSREWRMPRPAQRPFLRSPYQLITVFTLNGTGEFNQNSVGPMASKPNVSASTLVDLGSELVAVEQLEKLYELNGSNSTIVSSAKSDQVSSGDEIAGSYEDSSCSENTAPKDNDVLGLEEVQALLEDLQGLDVELESALELARSSLTDLSVSFGIFHSFNELFENVLS